MSHLQTLSMDIMAASIKQEIGFIVAIQRQVLNTGTKEKDFTRVKLVKRVGTFNKVNNARQLSLVNVK